MDKHLAVKMFITALFTINKTLKLNYFINKHDYFILK